MTKNQQDPDSTTSASTYRSYGDPSGVAKRVLAPDADGKLPTFDWLDAILMFGGLSALVALAVTLPIEDPQNLAFVGATPAFFGPLLIRNRLFPESRRNIGEPKQGAGARLLSVLGLFALVGSIFLAFLGLTSLKPAEPRASAQSFEVYLETQENGRRGGFALRTAQIAHDAARAAQGLPEEEFVPSEEWWRNYEAERRTEWEAFQIEEETQRLAIVEARRPQAYRMLGGGLGLALLGVMLIRARYPRQSSPLRPGVQNIRDFASEADQM